MHRGTDHVSASQQTAFNQYGNILLGRVALGSLHITWLHQPSTSLSLLQQRWFKNPYANPLAQGIIKKKLCQNYVLEINISHGTKMDLGELLCTLPFKIHTPSMSLPVIYFHRWDSIFVTAFVIGRNENLLIYTRATLAQLRPPACEACASHNSSATKWPWHKRQLSLRVVNQGMHKVSKAKHKTSNKNHAARRIPCPKALWNYLIN